MAETKKNFIFKNARIRVADLALIENLNLTVSQGERVLLLGPNGSGKSTLLSVLMGNRQVAGGSFASTFTRIGYVPQWKKVEFQYPLTVERMLSLAFPLPSFSIRRQKTRKAAVAAALAQVQMTDRKGRLLRECSGGELQRAFLARAFLLEPDLMILDEPISAVDQDGRNLILGMLQDYCQRHNPAVVLTVHDREPGWEEFFTRRVKIHNSQLEEEQ